MSDARAKFRRKRPLRELNRGTGGPGVEDVSTPAISNRARRRTQKEVHGSVRTRPTSVRLTTASETPGVMSYHAWPSPCRPTLATVERGTRQLTDEERTQLATAARFARHAGTPSIKELAREWKISPTCVYDIINRQRLTGSAAALRRTGPAHLLTDADEAVLAELSEELDGEYTWEEMTERFNERTGKNVSTPTVFRFCKSRGWREVCDKYVPCLTSADVKARREWAEQHVNYAWIGRENLRHDNLRDDWKKVAWIDIDEKWFYMRTRKKKKLHEGQKRSKTAVKSKRFIDKVMGLCAVGRPQGDFDGIIGIYRCSEKRQAERNSKFHARGEWYEVDCEVNGEMFRSMVQTKLIPDIQRKLLGYDCVYVQMDGARAHVKFWEDLVKLGAGRRQINGQKTPIIRFVRQPANSPDTNVLDLCFFRSLAKLVSKKERTFKQGYEGKEAFWKHVVKTFYEYHDERTMDRCWRTKSAVVQSILDAQGTNDYELPHGYIESKPIAQELRDVSSDEDEPLVRTLSFEDAQGVLPCSLPHSLPR